jgi:GT2 family glycosyltransferase
MSVVIPTLGGDTLSKTIGQLNRGTVVPAEILVCIPEEYAFRAEGLPFDNVKVVRTSCRGQVAQRAAGFGLASNEIVMQLDDDIMVDEGCVESLMRTLVENGPNAAAAPALIDRLSHDASRTSGTKHRLFYFLMNGCDGYRMGIVSKAGVEFGFDLSKAGNGVHDAEWLPGGCLMHFRENLITENYFPFAGKAYCEDLFHSYHLAKKGIRLKLNLDTSCSYEYVKATNHGIREFMKIISSDYRVRKYYVKLTSRSSLRMHLFYLIMVCDFLIKKLLQG